MRIFLQKNPKVIFFHKKKEKEEEYFKNGKNKKYIKDKRMDKLKFFSLLFFIIEEFCHLHKAMGGIVPHHGMQHNDPITTMR